MCTRLYFAVSSLLVILLLLVACNGTAPVANLSPTVAPVDTPVASAAVTTTAGLTSTASVTATANPPAAQSTTVVEIEAGLVEGAVADEILSFKGIPYAAPPVGDQRWRAPQPVTPWTGVRAATAFGHDCMQVVKKAIEPIQTTPSEDCLFVNVWRPASLTTTTSLPVMVWVHGGGYVGGGTSIPYYDGSAFARQGMVVVSFNYRLGRFGFFAHPALLAAQEGPVGNFGYMDQIAALQWVQTNIRAFGGDPQQVTLVGESAGGASVLTLLTSPAARGLFQRVMIMSGGGREALISRPMTGGSAEQPSADQIDASFAASLGITGDGPEALSALRALSPEVVVGDLDLERVLQAALLGTQIYPGTGMVDGVIVTAPPQTVFRNSGAANVPLIIGTTAADLPLIFPPSKLDPFAYFGADAEAARAAYNVPATLDQNSLTLLLLSIGADMTMHEPARFAAKAMTATGNPVWLYRFTYTAEVTRPAAKAQSHAGELPFLFDTLAAKYGDKATDSDRQMAHAFNTYVSNFVKSGDPNGANLPAWPPFAPTQFDLLNFTLDDGPVFGPDPRPGVALVERAADKAAATATAAVQETAPMTATGGMTSTTPSPTLSPNEQQLVMQAMNLVAMETGVAATTLTLTSIEAVEWPDSSLGCPQPGAMYMQVITPGYQITLTAANGTVYAVHSGSTPTVPIVLCTAATSESGAAAAQNTAILSGILTGTVTYRQRIALPTGSVITVELQDVSRADAAATVLATQTITTSGETVPIAFELVYDPGQIAERFSYAVRAQIHSNGVLRWTSMEQYAVLTHGTPTTGVEVVVMPAQ